MLFEQGDIYDVAHTHVDQRGESETHTQLRKQKGSKPQQKWNKSCPKIKDQILSQSPFIAPSITIQTCSSQKFILLERPCMSLPFRKRRIYQSKKGRKSPYLPIPQNHIFFCILPKMKYNGRSKRLFFSNITSGHPIGIGSQGPARGDIANGSWSYKVIHPYSLLAPFKNEIQRQIKGKTRLFFQITQQAAFPWASSQVRLAISPTVHGRTNKFHQFSRLTQFYKPLRDSFPTPKSLG